MQLLIFQHVQSLTKALLALLVPKAAEAAARPPNSKLASCCVSLGMPPTSSFSFQ